MKTRNHLGWGFSGFPWLSRWRKSVVYGLLGLGISGAIALGLSACSPNSNSQLQATAQKPDVEITLVSFAVTRAAHQHILPKFAKQWQQEHNQRVLFNQSYGGSGTQTRAVIDGLDADVVHLSLALDVNKIVKAGLIKKGWEGEFPNQSIASRSVAALVTRPGNPKNLKTWTDLAQDGVKLVTADPKTSGGARWNFLALWNAALKSEGTPDKALALVTKIYKNVPILTRDAREATDVFFNQQQGDALINYENEVILASQRGEKLDYLIPDINVSIDNPVAIVDRNVDKHGNREVVEAFVQYLFTPEAQAEFAKVGFRPINGADGKAMSDAIAYPPVKDLTTVKELGGWTEIQKQFFADDALFDQIRRALKSAT